MLFISKQVNNQSFLDFVAKKNIVLIDQPMISFEPVDFKCPSSSDFDIVFFTSPRSVKFYLEKCGLTSKNQIATIGESTASYLQEKGYRVDFSSQISGQPDKVSQAFSVFAKGKKVLFPQSNRSHRSMQKGLEVQQIIDLVVYKTLLKPQKINGQPTILVFTSPTNAESYLLQNKIAESQSVVAWGKTTENFLENKGIKSKHVLKTSTFAELQDVLEEYY